MLLLNHWVHRLHLLCCYTAIKYIGHIYCGVIQPPSAFQRLSFINTGPEATSWIPDVVWEYASEDCHQLQLTWCSSSPRGTSQRHWIGPYASGGNQQEQGERGTRDKAVQTIVASLHRFCFHGNEENWTKKGWISSFWQLPFWAHVLLMPHNRMWCPNWGRTAYFLNDPFSMSSLTLKSCLIVKSQCLCIKTLCAHSLESLIAHFAL